MVQAFTAPGHPYYPPGADIPDYIPNASSVNELIVRFGSLLGITVSTALWLAIRSNTYLRPFDKFLLGWFILCRPDEPWVFGDDACADTKIQAALSTASLKVRTRLPHHKKYHSSNQIRVIKGYFVLNHKKVASSQDLFAQLWKEYALSDSRYLTSDPFMICVETITAVCYAETPQIATKRRYLPIE